MSQFDHPIQTAPAVGAQLGIDRSTLTRAFNSEALKESAYRSADTILIDTEHPHFKEWLEAHRHHHRSLKREG
jgi:fatty-acid desaturase